MLCVLPHVYVERDTAHPLSRSELGLPEPRAACFVETPSKYCPNGQKNGRARRLAREKQVFEVRRAHSRAPQSFLSAAIRIAVAVSIGRTIAAKKFHLMSPVERPARFGVPHVSAERGLSWSHRSSKSSALACTAERSSPIRPLGEAPWGAPLLIVLTVRCAASLKIFIVTSTLWVQNFVIIDPCKHTMAIRMRQ